jgi:4-alpha-glucanotransferase
MADPRAWGIAPGYHDVRGQWVPSPPAGVEAALAAMRAIGDAPPPAGTWVVRRADGVHVPWSARLRTEDGECRVVSGWVPPEDLPVGYHSLSGPVGDVRLIVSPGICPMPERGWGWAVQLYAARSRASWGMGDLADLRSLARWTADAGGRVLLLNPLHAVAPVDDQQASPYFPASRRWRNPCYLRVEEVPGAPTDLGVEGRALGRDRRIDRNRVWALKREALTRAWAASGPSDEFVRWAARQGELLVGWSTWAALAEEHGGDWRTWPPGLRQPDGREVAAWLAAHRDRVWFHSWLQWLVERQLGDAASQGPALISDLAIGADPGGADAWQWQDVTARGVTVGAPPDEFNVSGQDWGFPPFDPWRLRAAGYEPFVQIVRAAIEGAGGVRIDHVAGLSRLYWVPEGRPPTEGVYVSYPWEDLLNVVALEATRADAFVVGEDLGTVEPWFREALAQWGVLSYRLLWFEDAPSVTWPEGALAAVTTHDLPTIAGVCAGTDLSARRSIGVAVDEEAERTVRERLAHVTGSDGPSPEDAVVAAYRAVAAAPSLLVTATLEDALLVEERPNQPGTTDEWPNWSLALPAPIEELESDPRVARLVDAIVESRRGCARPPAGQRDAAAPTAREEREPRDATAPAVEEQQEPRDAAGRGLGVRRLAHVDADAPALDEP